ncbi:hypothetical protein MIND_00519900 [Mycena indigotica]|uniref:Uncharacterized protein n=1 Tax=Mycena indigotica TaxID=2126181 RepID=A0A8H6W729_9AGAR|nr:uncharacterized protein MIND_00519900 [Mycena indigotica]KAF7307262.1 hypothetical protein MIND_00519900 [Mycena indigotica]
MFWKSSCEKAPAWTRPTMHSSMMDLLKLQSRYGFPRVLKEAPGLARYGGKTMAEVLPRYRFGWLMTFTELYDAAPEELRLKDRYAQAWAINQIIECCKSKDEEEIGAYALMGKFLGLICVHFTDNMTEESMAKAEDDELMAALMKIFKTRKEDAVWFMSDYRLM